MNLFKWWKWPQSVRSDALSLYKHGLARAEKHDAPGAMVAYSSAIALHDAPQDVKAMALYNRALLYAAAGDTAKARGDLNTVMSMSLPLRGVKLAAKRRLDRLHRREDAAADSSVNRRTTP